MPAAGLEEIQGAGCVGIKIIERNCGCAIMRGLSCGVHNQVRAQLSH